MIWIIGFQIKEISASFLAETKNLMPLAEKEVRLISLSKAKEVDDSLRDSISVMAISLIVIRRDNSSIPFMPKDLLSL
jgi:hypothetical protein